VLRTTQAIKRVDRETVGGMRAEIERAFAPKAPEAEPVEARPAAPSRDDLARRFAVRNEGRQAGSFPLQLRMPLKASRLALLVVSLVAGGVAAYVATRPREAPVVAAPPVTEIALEPMTSILVAAEAISTGQRLSAEAVQWTEWPLDAVRPEYFTIDAAPDAASDMTASVARAEILPGEPIRPEKLAPAGRGYLATILDSGMRAVAVPVAASAASGGFVLPNDRVDIVVTRTAGTGQVSETVLSNVLVLAIDARLAPSLSDTEPTDPQAFQGQAIATVAVDPDQAEVLITATRRGDLSLVLRPTLETADTEPGLSTANQAIRSSSPFWAR
jgi:pilus assembly protein CpaB